MQEQREEDLLEELEGIQGREKSVLSRLRDIWVQKVFEKHPQVHRIKLHIEGEYNDQGGTFNYVVADYFDVNGEDLSDEDDWYETALSDAAQDLASNPEYVDLYEDFEVIRA